MRTLKRALMEQLPQIVRDRLNKQAARQHPDADLLTAFAEDRLSGWEREPMLEHMAQCGQCRHIVSLATAEPAPGGVTGRPAASVAAHRSRYPALLRWGALATSFALLSAAGVLFYGRRAHRFEMRGADRYGVGSDLGATIASKSSAPAAPSIQPSQELESKKLKSQSAARRIKPEAKSSMSPAGAKEGPKFRAGVDLFSTRVGGLTLLGRGLESPKTQAASQASPPSLFPAEPSKAPNSLDKIPRETVEVDAANASVPLETRADESRKTEKVTPPSRLQAAHVQMGNTALTETSASVHGPTLMSDWVVPQWTLSDEGLPERSFDSGKTWEKVQVDHTTGFRALSAQGLDVWVGGPGGALYHSADFGLHWTRVAVISGGDSLTSEIVGIEFSDALHGTVTTSAHQIWITPDAGKTWQKR